MYTHPSGLTFLQAARRELQKQRDENFGFLSSVIVFQIDDMKTEWPKGFDYNCNKKGTAQEKSRGDQEGQKLYFKPVFYKGRFWHFPVIIYFLV